MGNVDVDQGVIRIETSKSGEGREVPLTESMIELMLPMVVNRDPEEPLFPVRDMRYAWRRLCDDAGVAYGKNGYVIHDTRRTAARTKRSAGVSESVTNATMGWKPGSKMLSRYGLPRGRGQRRPWSRFGRELNSLQSVMQFVRNSSQLSQNGMIHQIIPCTM